MSKIKLRKTIFKSSFCHLNKVILCLGEEEFAKCCKKHSLQEYKIDKDGITIRVRKTGKRTICIIGLKYEGISAFDLTGILLHEIVHATDFIMEESDFTDKEMRAYITHDMYLKSILFIKSTSLVDI